MNRLSLTLFAIIAVPAFFSLGCGSSASSSATPEPESASAEDAHGDHAHDDGHEEHAEHGEHGDHEHHADAGHDGESDMEKMTAELAKLSPEDRASAEKQHFCPVTGEMLGTMGAPLKMDVKDQTVWICCEGCEKKLLENPDEYLAKLNKD